MLLLSHRRLCRLFVFPLFAPLLVCGCQTKEEIRSYTVAKEEKKEEVEPTVAAAVSAPNSAEATDRMLGAIVPVGDQTWYFKVVGPMATVEANATKIEEF